MFNTALSGTDQRRIKRASAVRLQLALPNFRDERQRKMFPKTPVEPTKGRLAILYSGLLLTLLRATAIPAISADDRKTETIDAQAMGTSTQMGRNVGVNVIISHFSTQE